MFSNPSDSATVFDAEPKVRIVRLEPVSLTKREAWFRVPDYNYYIVLRFGDGSAKIAVIRSGKIEGMYSVNGGLDCSSTQIVLDGGVEVCQAVSHVLNNYQNLLEQYELEERAKAADVLGGRVVPSMPKEWETLVYSLTKMILEKRVIKTFYFYDGNREVVLGVYCYEGGYYVECEDTLRNELSKFVEDCKLLDARLGPTLAGLVIKNIEMRTMTFYRPAKRCLLFKDKVLCWDRFIQTKDLESSLVDPYPELIVTHRIPWAINTSRYKDARLGLSRYIPPKSAGDIVELFKALAPKSFKAFLDWVRRPEESEEDAYPRMVLLLEVIGYTLYPHDYPFHKAVLLVGEGSNGKSTYLRLLEKILGKGNIASVSLMDLDPAVNRFAVADLWGKLANLSSEPPRGRYNPTRFKQLTGEDPIRFERKHRDAFTDHNYAKLIFSANELPEVTEDTYAFWRRWIVIEFPNRFPPNPRFFEETFTPDEVEGIIICALHSFRLVIERGGFTEQGAKDPREEWLARSNPVYYVVKRMIEDGLVELDPKGLVVKKDLYEMYKRYLDRLRIEEDFDTSPVEQKDFTRYLTRYFPVRTGSPRVGDRKVNAYIGIRIKDYEKARKLVGHLETPRTL